MSRTTEDPSVPLVGMKKRKRSSFFYTIPTPRKSQTRQENNGRLSTRFESVGIKLFVCKELYVRRKKICDASLVTAIVGIVLMVIETELNAAKVISRSDVVSIVLKFSMTASTLALLFFIFLYHKVGVQLFSINYSTDDWRLAMHKKRILTFVVEAIICVVHPVPGEFYIKWHTTDINGTLAEKPITIPLDVVLSIPMMFRLYLVGRFIMLHSHLYQNASCQSLGALNHVRFNFRFIFKCFMTLYPDYFLILFVLGYFIITSWALRLCEMYNDDEENRLHGTYLNSMWLNAITFLTVGYGDIVPNSYCGRGIVVLTGIVGTGITALIVAVLARKLEMSHAEKCLHDFVLEIDIGSKLKVEAANVIKRGWKIYKYNKIEIKTLAQERKQLHLQTLYMSATHKMRELKNNRRLLHDHAVTLVAVSKAQNEISASVKSIQARQISLEDRIAGMENTLALVYDKVCALNRSGTDRVRSISASSP